MRAGQRGLCFVRMNNDGALVLDTYGRSSGFCIDPVEKKPLYHFLPGSAVLSFGTAGCNLTCRFCQNWDISTSRTIDTTGTPATPAAIATAAEQHGCRSVAYTYNDPVVFLEYATATALECRARGIRNIAVTAGYITQGAREDLFSCMDAANVDLKSFSPDFYSRQCGGELSVVKDTLRYLRVRTNVWLEITTLLIPGLNDDPCEIRALADWIASELGLDVPLHFTAFHPDYRMRDRPATTITTLRRAYDIARERGLYHVYIGNVRDIEGSTTSCPGCGHTLICREAYDITIWQLDAQGACPKCGTLCAGIFDARPGAWGSRREPIFIPS